MDQTLVIRFDLNAGICCGVGQRADATGTEGHEVTFGIVYKDTNEKAPGDIRVDTTVKVYQFDVIVRAVNDAPTAINHSASFLDGAAARQVIDARTLFNDVDGDELALSLSGNPDWISIDPNEMLVINGSIPSGASQIESAAGKGIYKFWVNADDGNGGTAQSEVTIDVSNVDPTASTVDPQLFKDGAAAKSILNLSTVFTDTDGDILEYGLGTDAPDWIGLNVSTGALEIIGKVPANASEAGSGTYKNRYDFTVTANDNEGGTAQQTITIFAVNVVPTPTDTIAAASVDDGQSSGEIIDMSTHFADTDGDTDHIYSITNTDNTITDLFEIDATTGVISIKDGASIPINASTTSGYTITVQIDDKEGGITTKDVTITVANIAPVAVTDPVTVDVTDAQTAGGILDASGLFTDGDGDDLEFSMTGGPDWLVIDPISGAVSIAKGGVPAGASVN